MIDSMDLNESIFPQPIICPITMIFRCFFLDRCNHLRFKHGIYIILEFHQKFVIQTAITFHFIYYKTITFDTFVSLSLSLSLSRYLLFCYHLIAVLCVISNYVNICLGILVVWLFNSAQDIQRSLMRVTMSLRQVLPRA